MNWPAEMLFGCGAQDTPNELTRPLVCRSHSLLLCLGASPRPEEGSIGKEVGRNEGTRFFFGSTTRA